MEARKDRAALLAERKANESKSNYESRYCIATAKETGLEKVNEENTSNYYTIEVGTAPKSKSCSKQNNTFR